MRLTSAQLAIAIGIAILPVLGFALGWLQDGDVQGGPARGVAAAPEWAPRPPVMRDLAADANLLAVKQPFGAPKVRAASAPGANTPATGASAESNPLQWRLGGIVVTEASRYLVVLLRQAPQNTERSELRSIGQTLPDGSVIQSVDPSSVTIDRQGTIVRVRMFARN